MCGIVGYLGQDEAYPILIEALKRLEYRGYDSAGIAVSCDGRIEIARQKGKVDELRKAVRGGLQGEPRPCPHEVGYPRHALRAECPSPQGRGCRRRPQRHRGKLCRAERAPALEGAQIPLRHGHGGHTSPHLGTYERRGRVHGSSPALPGRDARLLCPRHYQGRRADAHCRKKGEPPRPRHRRRGVLHRERCARPHRKDEQVHLPRG